MAAKSSHLSDVVINLSTMVHPYDVLLGWDKVTCEMRREGRHRVLAMQQGYRAGHLAWVLNSLAQGSNTTQRTFTRSLAPGGVHVCQPIATRAKGRRQNGKHMPTSVGSRDAMLREARSLNLPVHTQSTHIARSRGLSTTT